MCGGCSLVLSETTVLFPPPSFRSDCQSRSIRFIFIPFGGEGGGKKERRPSGHSVRLSSRLQLLASQVCKIKGSMGLESLNIAVGVHTSSNTLDVGNKFINKASKPNVKRAIENDGTSTSRSWLFLLYPQEVLNN